MRAFQFAWTFAAWFLVASAFAAPLVVLVQRCKARGKRKFADEPLARVLQLHPTADHSRDIVG